MTALRAAVERAVSAFSAVLHTTGGSPDFMALQCLLRDSEHGLTPEERTAIEAADEAKLAAEIEAEILQRRMEDCWPHGAQRIRKPVPN